MKQIRIIHSFKIIEWNETEIAALVQCIYNPWDMFNKLLVDNDQFLKSAFFQD